MSIIKDPNDVSGYGVAADEKQATIISYMDDESTDITIPQTFQGSPLRRIGFGAFRGADRLQTVILPDTVVTIDNSAFRNCPSLEKVVLSKNLRNISDYAFANCPKLKSVTLPSDLVSISMKVFAKCYAFTEMIVTDCNVNDGSAKRFVVPSRNESRRYGFLNACLTYFDSYSMLKYDAGYPVIQEFDDIFNIAEYRLQDSEQLTDYTRRLYENSIRMFIPKLIREDQVGRLSSAGELGLIRADKIDEYLDLASEFKGSCMAYLLEFKEKNYKRPELDFTL